MTGQTSERKPHRCTICQRSRIHSIADFSVVYRTCGGVCTDSYLSCVLFSSRILDVLAAAPDFP